MNKILKPIIALFKVLYNILDKLIVTPISKLIYRINKLGKNSKKLLQYAKNRTLDFAQKNYYNIVYNRRFFY